MPELIVIIGLSVIAAIAIVLLIVEKSRLAAWQNYVQASGLIIAETLAKVAYGGLDATMPDEITVKPKLAKVAITVQSIRQQLAATIAEPLYRLCYVGTDGWLEGSKCAEVIGKKIGGQGRVAIVVTSNTKVLIMAQRYRSFVGALAENFPKIEVVAVCEAQTENAKAADFVKDIAKKVDAIYVTGNSVVLGAAEGLAMSGLQNQVYLLCHDIDENIAPQMKKGVVGGSLVSSTIAQGRDPILHLYNHLVSGWKPAQPRLITPFELVDKSTMDQFWDTDRKALVETASLHQTGVSARAASTAKLRILILQEDWNKAFVQMNLGMKAAQDILVGHNVEFVSHIINQTRRPKTEVLAELVKIIDQEVGKGLNGIVTYVGLPDLVPILNQQIAKKIPVTTYNSEPFSLRSVVMWLLQSSVELDRYSSDYQHGHHEINEALQEILSTIHGMVDRLAHESASAKSGAKASIGLLHMIDQTSLKEDQQVQTIEASSAISTQLSGMTDFFAQRVSGLNDMKEQVQIFGGKIEAMTEYSEKIRSIISIIENVSDQTNLLAFNAAIEASRAGESGRGFKVIAEEIRNLADKTAASTKDVSSLITAMRLAMSETTQANARTRAIVDDQVEAITQASRKLDELSDHLVTTMQTVQVAAHDNAKMIQEMKQTTNQLQEVVNQTSEASTDNSLAIETLSSTFAEISAQFSEMNRQTQQLGQLILILRGTVAQLSAT